LANFVSIGLSRGLRRSSTTRRVIACAFRDATKILGAILLFSVTPALALQHGGGGGGHSGGGGGGGHFGGGGGGHASSGGGHPATSGQHASAPRPSSGPSSVRVGAPVATTHSAGPSGTAPGARVVSRLAQVTHIAEPGYLWEATPGYSNRVGPAAPKDLGKRGYVWEEGPSSGAAGEKSSYFLTENMSPRTETAPRAGGGTFAARGSVSPHSNAVILSRRPIPSASIGARSGRFNHNRRPPFYLGGFYPFGFFPGFFYDDCLGAGFDYGYGYGFGYGYNPCGYGYFYPGYGYSMGGSYSDFTGNVTNDTMPYGAPSLVPDSEPSAAEATAPPSAAAPSPNADSTVLFLKDGTSFAVTDYWLESGRLHYVTTYGGANAIELEALDTQRTVDENARNGVTFTLRPPHWEDKNVAPKPEPQKQQE
jgi:hypothetical protein